MSYDPVREARAERLVALLLVSTPRGLKELPTGALVDAIQRTARDYDIQLVVQTGATVQRLKAALNEYTPEMVHFIAHAKLDETGTTTVAFTTDDGRVMWVRDRDLADLLGDARPRVVVLDVPDRGEFAARLIDAGIESVIEPRMAMPLDVSVIFHRTLYRQIGAGEDVATAVQRARIAAASEASLRPDAVTPAAALYTSSRENAPLVTRRSAQTPDVI